VPNGNQSDNVINITSLIIILFLISTINYLDRQVPFVLIEHIKKDLQFSDKEIGIVSSVAFTLIYSLLAIPLSALADRWSTKWTLVGCMVVWCALTAGTSLAQGIVFFALCRMGVAAGEAACLPSSHSLVSTWIPLSRRGLAFAAISLGAPIGGTLGMVMGGWLGDTIGWRSTMVMVGIPGLILAGVTALAVPGNRSVSHSRTHLGVFRGIREIWGTRSIRYILIGLSIQGMAQYAIYTFSSAFLMRSHGLSTASMGFGLGMATGVAGITGLLVAGIMTNRFEVRMPHLLVLVPATAFIISAPLILAAFSLESAVLAMIVLGMINFCTVFYMPPIFSTVQRLAPPGNKALSSSLILVGIGLVGGCLGPFGVGAISDALTTAYGPDALRHALYLAAVPMLIGGVLVLLAARCVTADLAAYDQRYGQA
jgi:predicted MFS family arabinose efflux permease